MNSQRAHFAFQSFLPQKLSEFIPLKSFRRFHSRLLLTPFLSHLPHLNVLKCTIKFQATWLIIRYLTKFPEAQLRDVEPA